MQGSRPANPTIDEKFLDDFAKLKYGYFDGVKFANDLEKIICNTFTYKNKPVHYFADDIAAKVVASKQPDNTYRIDTSDTDIIKYCKSFINFVRAIEGINVDIIESYKRHLRSPDALSIVTDSNLRSIMASLVTDAYNNSGEQFIRFHKHFMEFRYYAVEFGDLILQMPFIVKKYRETVEVLTNTYAKSNTKYGIDLVKAKQEEIQKALDNVIATKKIPHIPANHLLAVFSNFGLRTHIDTWTEMAEALCSNNQKEYVKTSDCFIYDVATVSTEDRGHMDLYNACSGAKNAFIAANAALSKINASEENKKVGEPWININEEMRQEYIKLNDAMRELTDNIDKLKPMLQQEPELYAIYKKDAARIQSQIKLLKSWEASKAGKKIDILKGSLTPSNIFAWTKEYTEAKLADQGEHFDAINDLYRINNIADETVHNMMLIYNINSRLETAYPRVQRFREEGFSLGLIPEACRLLFEIGNIIKDYRNLRGTEITALVRDKIEQDVNLLLNEMTKFFHNSTFIAQKLETTQGLQPNLIMSKLESILKAYGKLIAYNAALPKQYKLNLNTTLLKELSQFTNAQENAKYEVDTKEKERIATAIEVRKALHHVKNADDPLNLVELVRTITELKKLNSYKAKQYIQFIQLVIDKLLGLDALAQEIYYYEQAIKEIIGDNTTQLHTFENNEEINGYRAIISELYNKQATIKDRLDAIEINIDNPAVLDTIQTEHFHVLGYKTRGWNHIKSMVGFESVSMYQLEPGVHPGLDEDSLAAGLIDFHIMMLEDLNAIIKPIDDTAAVRYTLMNIVREPLTLFNLVCIAIELKKINSDAAREYLAYIQTEIDDMSGLSELENQIDNLNLAINDIAGPDKAQPLTLEDTERVDNFKNLIVGLRELQNTIKSSLQAIAQNRHNPENLLEPTLAQLCAKMVNPQATSRIIRHNHAMIDDLNANLEKFGIIESNTPTRNADKANTPKKETNQEIINKAIPKNETLIKHILHSRKGYAVTQIEALRHMFIDYAKPYIHPDYLVYFEGTHLQANDTYLIVPQDTIATVNIKAFHNAISRMEPLLVLLNYIAEAPTEGKIAKAFLVKRVKDSLPELKVRLNNFIHELQVLLDALRALRGGLLNNTINIFEKDVVAELVKWLSYTQAGINYYYDNLADNATSNEKNEINETINDIIHFISGNKDEDEDETNRFDYNKDLLNYIEAPNQDEDDSDIKHDAKLIIRQAIKNAGNALTHISNASDIMNGMNNEPGATNNEDQIMIFLRLFVQHAGNMTPYRDGTYAIENLPDGSLTKCIAAFLNCSNSITSFMDSSVSMVDGHQITGFVRSLYHLARIKYQLDQSQLLSIFQDGLQQYKFNAHVVHELIDALIIKSCNYIQPKVIDFVAQARIAEKTLGLHDGILLDKFEWVIDTLMTIGKTIAPGKLDNLKSNYPYDKTTLAIAETELLRLSELEGPTESKQPYYGNAINSLKSFRENLRIRLSVSSPALKASAAKEASNPVKPKTVIAPAHYVEDNNKPAMDSNIPKLKASNEDLFTDDESSDYSSFTPKDGWPKVPDLETTSDDDTAEFTRDGYTELDQLKKQGNTKKHADSNEETLKNLIKLKLACSTYKHHLASEIDRLSKLETQQKTAYFSTNRKHHKVSDVSANLRIAIEKFNIIVALQDSMKESKSPYLQLVDFNAALTPVRRFKLSQNRDTATSFFLKVLATIFSFGIAAAAGLWKSSGQKLVDKVDYLNPPERRVVLTS